eukprot:gene3568-4496_t
MATFLSSRTIATDISLAAAKSTARQPRPQKVQKLAAPAPSAAATSDAALRRSTPEGGSTSGTKRQHSEGAMPIPASKRLCQLANADVCVEGQQQKQRGGKKKRGKGKGSKDQAKVCRFWRNNPLECRKGDDCPYAHTFKVEPCKMFHLEGGCRHGDNCHYSHEPVEPEQLQKLK